MSAENLSENQVEQSQENEDLTNLKDNIQSNTNTTETKQEQGTDVSNQTNYKKGKDNIKIKNEQVESAISSLNFYKIEGDEVIYNLENVKAYLTKVKDKTRDQLDQGERYSKIMAVQIFLQAKGYNVGEIDGIKGPNTESGVKAYQEKESIKVDGLPGPETINKMLGTTPQTTIDNSENDNTSTNSSRENQNTEVKDQDKEGSGNTDQQNKDTESISGNTEGDGKRANNIDEKATDEQGRTYTSGSNGRTFKNFRQCDAKRSGVGKIQQRGCAVMSTSTILSGYGVSDEKINNWIQQNKSGSISSFSILNESHLDYVHKNVKSNNKEQIKNDFINTLMNNKGNAILRFRERPWTTAGSHYIPVLDIRKSGDNYEAFIANTTRYKDQRRNAGWFTVNELFEKCTETYLITPQSA